MGAHPYWYYTPYQSDLTAALQALREQEFQAGRYYPVLSLNFPITEQTPSPGAKHPSIEAAIEASDVDGTRSILDIFRISDTPYPLSGDELDLELLAEENIDALYKTSSKTQMSLYKRFSGFFMKSILPTSSYVKSGTLRTSS
jgi:hypothetical protein